jgi:peptidoglycan/LPS O-acetylase OafA/YrhL
LHYRREVDGLRAVAVIPVILFHAGFAAFSGGYVGVDVFFVISGYLITSVILRDLQAGTFSLARFYERRIRRILPALFVMLIVCAPLSAILLMPSYSRLAADSLVAASVFASNLLYLRDMGYFGLPEQLRPLLHTWTLGVEEQYYLFFPLFAGVAWKLGKAWLVAMLAGLVAISAGFAEWAAMYHPNWGFYLLPARGWELGIGALLAFYLDLRPTAAWRMAWLQPLSFFGLALIAYAVLTFDDFTPTPSSYTLLPTVGAGLVILCASPATLAGRMLGSRVAVGIGLASYSLYLWHQPIFVFVRHRNLLPPSPTMVVAEFLALAAIAYLSWRFVERPFRRRDRFTRKQIFTLGAAASALLFTLGMIGHETNGTFGLDRNAALDSRLRESFVERHGLGVACVDGLISSARCRTSDRPEILVWGDSYAMHLVAGLLASRPDAKIEQATEYTCGPALGVAPVGGYYTRAWARDCIRNNDLVLRHLKATPSVKYVLLGALFADYAKRGKRLLLRDGRIVDAQSASLPAFLATIRAVRATGAEPIVVAPPPGNGINLGQCTKRAAYYDRSPAPCDFTLREAEQVQARQRALVRQLERVARVIWLDPAICSDDLCRPWRDNTFIYADDGHLTDEGSVYLGRKLDFYGFLRNRRNQGGGLPQP